MTQDQYLVAPTGDHWAVKLNGTTLRTFPERSEAMEAAVQVAQRSGEQGIAAQVLSAAPDGDIQPIWTYGRDTYSSA